MIHSRRLPPHQVVAAPPPHQTLKNGCSCRASRYTQHNIRIVQFPSQLTRQLEQEIFAILARFLLRLSDGYTAKLYHLSEETSRLAKGCCVCSCMHANSKWCADASMCTPHQKWNISTFREKQKRGANESGSNCTSTWRREQKIVGRVRCIGYSPQQV